MPELVTGGCFVGLGWHGMQVPDGARPRDELEKIVSDVDFPPVEALPRRGHAEVVIIVPTFAEGNEREQETVAAFVLGIVPAAAEGVGEGIDAKCAVEQEDGADEESPDEHLRA